jgi:hypothetical protein
MSNWNATKEKRKKISLSGRVRLKRLSIRSSQEHVSVWGCILMTIATV